MRVVPRTGPERSPAPPHHPARLTHARLTHARLTHARLTHARLTHARLTHARLTHARLTHARLTHADALHGCSGRLGYRPGPNVFAGCGRNSGRTVTGAHP
ncbi:pentapeptide repeat-containing protein [Nocardia flavorosea]|uniref:Pentapeptide repeat-containing protein n=1 Tax=Nocardia flavorosea TaxID=53429 RepID=A0A846YA08_9NOCA|nr:pentapeptide repeat-containing protein [Nocardia flavorosea]